MSLSIVALFAMQASWSYTFKMIYMWVTYLLVTIFSTCCNMPFGALNGVLTSDSGERAKLSGLRMVFANVGASWAGLIAVPLIVFFSGVGDGTTQTPRGYLLAVIVCTVLGVVIERLAYKPLRSAPSLAVLITAIGVSYFLQNSALLIWKAAARVYPPVVEGSMQLFGGKLTVSYVSLLTIAACVVIMIGLTTFVNKSKMGKAMRACSEDKAAAQLMGINVNATISATFAIGSALAAIAGVLLCSFNTSLMPTTGSMPGIKAFTAAVFGGIGSIPGAFLGGLLLGIIEAMAKAYISTNLANSIVFAVLIVVLLVKPAGLLGKSVTEKV